MDKRSASTSMVPDAQNSPFAEEAEAKHKRCIKHAPIAHSSNRAQGNDSLRLPYENNIKRDGAVTATSVSILDRDKVASDRGKKMQTRYGKFYFFTATRKEKLHDRKLTLPD